MFVRRTIFSLVLVIAFPAVAADTWPEPLPDDVRAVLEEAKRRAATIPEQADELARLAWPDGPISDIRVAVAAREDLVGFGRHAVHALRDSLRRVDPIYTADITAALIEGRYRERGAVPSNFVPALETAIWVGNIEARRIALKELARRPAYPLAMLSTIDALFDHPELALNGLRTLGQMRDPRARFFLTDVLRRGTDTERRSAAIALGKIGKLALDVLRREARSSSAAIRSAAITGLLPVSELDDLPLLLEYYGLHGDEDPALRERVLARATLLEEQLEALHRDPAVGED